jgi:hypothetical protein
MQVDLRIKRDKSLMEPISPRERSLKLSLEKHACGACLRLYNTLYKMKNMIRELRIRDVRW